MLSEKGVQALFGQTYALWIKPEISHRKQASLLPENFKIRQCLIKLPKKEPPIVEFNEEIKWIGHMQLAPGIMLKKGQDIYLHEVQKIWAVTLPEINGERVAFVYVFYNGFGYQMIFDFTPNTTDEDISREEKERGALSISTAIAESLQAILTEKAIRMHDSFRKPLQEIGLWAAPALLPYPLVNIIRQLEKNEIQGARDTLVEYCTSRYIERLSSKWWIAEQFNLRKKLLMDALDVHKMGKYGLSIYALIPQIEGIITDWICEALPDGETPPWRTESRVKKFRDLGISEKVSSTFTDKQIGESVIEVILGSVLKDFGWMEPIETAIPSRHVLGHGRYDESLLTEENSIKLFLLLDTIYYIISANLDTTQETCII